MSATLRYAGHASQRRIEIACPATAVVCLRVYKWANCASFHSTARLFGHSTRVPPKNQIALDAGGQLPFP